MGIKDQVAINTTETVKDKLKFERESQIQGVVINGHRAKNGVFNDSDFI